MNSSMHRHRQAACRPPTRMSPDPVTRRHALALGLGGAALTLLAACAPIAPANPPPASLAAPPGATSSSSAATGQPKKGGTLRIGRANEPSNLDGHLISPYGLNSTWMALDRLTAYDDKLQPQHRLAESWDLSPDSTQLKLNLRKGVMFHTGSELTWEV